MSFPEDPVANAKKMVEFRAILASLPVEDRSAPLKAYLAPLALTSQRTFRSVLNTIASVLSPRFTAETFPWHLLREELTQHLRVELRERYPVNVTLNIHVTALRCILKASWQTGYMSRNDYLDAADLQGEKKVKTTKGVHLTNEELEALFAACTNDPSAAGFRDAALFTLLYGGGLRRSESVGITLDRYDASTGTLKVFGKGSKERIVSSLDAGAVHYIQKWLDVRGLEPGPLICSVAKGGGRVTIRKLSGAFVEDRLKLRSEQAGIRKCTPVDLRRTFVGNLFKQGAHHSSIQEMMGHVSLSTTGDYNCRPINHEELSAAFAKIRVWPSPRTTPVATSPASQRKSAAAPKKTPPVPSPPASKSTAVQVVQHHFTHELPGPVIKRKYTPAQKQQMKYRAAQAAKKKIAEANLIKPQPARPLVDWQPRPKSTDPKKDAAKALSLLDRIMTAPWCRDEPVPGKGLDNAFDSIAKPTKPTS